MTRHAKRAARAPAAPPGSDLVAIDAIHPWADNPRKNAAAVAKVRASIEAFGWVRPIVVNSHPKAKGEIIVGHTARLAAIEMGLEQVPVRYVNLAPEKARAAAVADNKLGEISAWDNELLSSLMADGVISVEDMGIAGFSEDELAKLGRPPVIPPEEFADVSMDVTTNYTCPRCKYEWNGSPQPGKEKEERAAAKKSASAAPAPAPAAASARSEKTTKKSSKRKAA